MSTKITKIFQKRQFLNTDKKASGAIIASIEKETFKVKASKEPETYFNATLDLIDCNRKVTLDFCFGVADKKEIKEKLKKLQILRNTVNEFADALENQLNEALA